MTDSPRGDIAGAPEGRSSDRGRVAVIGSGLTGLTAAHRLTAAGFDVVVLEKARGAGGRMSTRRAGAYVFDHGAQYFTAKDARFRTEVAAWRRQDLVRRWQARISVVDHTGARPPRSAVERFVGVPGMSAVCRHLARRLPDCRFSWRVAEAGLERERWSLRSDTGAYLTADWLLSTAPPAQSCALVGGRGDTGAAAGVELQPCWAVMAVFDRPLSSDWDAAFVNAGPLSWVASQASRPGRPAAHAWVLHASAQWSRAHLEDDGERVCEALIAEAFRLAGAKPAQIESAAAHRWRYALAEHPLEEGACWYPDRRLVLAGDWCCGSRVEGAYLSGLSAASRIIDA